MKHLLFIILFLSAVVIYAQPPNIKVGAADNSNMPWLGCVTSSSGVQHLYILARTPFPKTGYYISSNGGQSWTGSNAVPDSVYGNDPWGAMDPQDSEIYACYNFKRVARASNWGATWSYLFSLGGKNN